MNDKILESKLSKTLAKNADDEFGCAGCQKFNNSGVSLGHQLLDVTPLLDVCRDFVVDSDHLDLSNFAVRVEES